MFPMIFALVGAVGSVGSFFVNLFRKKKLDAVTQVSDAASEIVSTVGATAMNIADSRSESWLARNWRPMCMLVFLAMIISRWLGYQPPHMSPDEIVLIYNFMGIGLGGMIASRGIEKVARTMSIGKVYRGLMDNRVENRFDPRDTRGD